jgi:hypothetical protein
MLSTGHGILDELLESGRIKDTGPKPSKFFSSSPASKARNNPEIVGYINRYFEVLKIPLDDGEGNYEGVDEMYLEEVGASGGVEAKETDKHPNYKGFALDLIRFAQHFRIAAASMDSSKCAGIIYILSTHVENLTVPIDSIEKECDISKSTFCKFSKEIDKMINTDNPGCQKTKRKLRHLFKKYEIPTKRST